MVELRPRLHLLRLGFGQAYLWQDDDAWTLVDTGIPGSGPEIGEALHRLGLDTPAIRTIVATHGHEDHFGSAAQIRGWHGAPVHAHTGDAAVIRGEQRRRDPVLTAFDAPIWEQLAASGVPDLDPPPCPVDVELHDGDRLDIGGGAQVLAVPGHTPGSIALHLSEPGVLFTGDTVARTPDGEVILGVFNLDEDAMIEGFHRLAELDAETVCFGHGEPVVTGAGPVLRRAAAAHRRRPPAPR